MDNTYYFWVSLLFFLIPNGRCYFSRTPLGEPYYVYGIGPVCRNYSLNDTTIFQKQARYHDKVTERFFFHHDMKNSWLKNMKLYHYLHFDVCEGSGSLLKFLVEVLLNPKYTITEDPSAKARRKIAQWKYQPNILVIFTFLTDEMFIRLAEILSQTNILVVNLHSNVQFHQNTHIVPKKFTIIYNETLNFFRDVITALDWRYISIVNFEDRLSPSREYHHGYKQLFLDMGICFNTDSFVFNVTRANRTIDRLKMQQGDDVILLVGPANRQLTFMNLVGHSKKTWVLSDNFFADRARKNVSNVMTITDNFTPYRYELYLLKARAVFIYKNLLLLKQKQLYSFNYLTKLYQFLFVFHKAYWGNCENINNLVTLKTVVLSVTKNISLSLNVDKDKVIRRNEDYNVDKLRLSMLDYKNRRNVLSKCPTVECEPGREYIFKRLEVNETQWDESYRWSCQLCSPGFYKRNYGNSSCEQCPVNEVSNERRDSCYDPYILKAISFQQPFSILAISLACFGICCCGVVFIAFIKFRTTPMMKAADVNMTMVHLLIIAFNLVFQPFLFMGKPVKLKCYGRLLALTICYTLANAVILLRSQKVLMAFQSRVKLNKSEIQRAKLAGLLSAFLLVVTANLFLLVSVVSEPVKVIEKWDHEHFEKTFYCNTWKHSIGLVTFNICLHIVCFVQAFRGRRLPGAFKETMSIVYGSFITIVVFIVLYPIVFFHKDVLERDSVFWIAVTLNLDILVMFCYLRRVYVAVFLPEINTPEYSRGIIIAKMKKDSENQIKYSLSD